VPRNGGSTIDLVAGPAAPVGIVADEDRVDWAETGNVFTSDGGSVNQGGALGENVLSSNAQHEYPRAGAAPYAITADEDYLYWTDANSGNIYRTPRASLNESVVLGALPPEIGVGVELLVDGPWVYVLAGTSTTGPRKLAWIVAVPRCGDGPPRVLTDSELNPVTSLVSDESYLYFADPTGIVRLRKP
jgi:hypothetical protein